MLAIIIQIKKIIDIAMIPIGSSRIPAGRSTHRCPTAITTSS
jgi:hypothetical protein